MQIGEEDLLEVVAGKLTSGLKRWIPVAGKQTSRSWHLVDHRGPLMEAAAERSPRLDQALR